MDHTRAILLCHTAPYHALCLMLAYPLSPALEAAARTELAKRDAMQAHYTNPTNLETR
jgi:hypothetical protein